MKNITLLGSTGSIGRSACEVVDAFSEDFTLVGMAAGNNVELFRRQVAKYRPSIVSMISKKSVDELKKRLGNPSDIEFCWGTEGLVRVAEFSGADIALVAVVGGSGLLPTAAAIGAGHDIALANKETMVMAGEIITDMARAKGVKIIPVDSEHSAIFQCLAGNDIKNAEKLILTASGGPFRECTCEELKNVTVAEALKHPNWSMGSKITIDSATLMNKGLEVIEAFWLFGVGCKKINVVIHPESIVHSMVQYIDGSVVAQLGLPDMKLPILYALAYPDRMEFDMPRLDLCEVGSLSFATPDVEKFPCLKLAFDTLLAGGGSSVVLNAANEIAVERFLAGQLAFLDIHEVIKNAISSYKPKKLSSIEEILKIDSWARDFAAKECHEVRNC